MPFIISITVYMEMLGSEKSVPSLVCETLEQAERMKHEWVTWKESYFRELPNPEYKRSIKWLKDHKPPYGPDIKYSPRYYSINIAEAPHYNSLNRAKNPKGRRHGKG